MRRNHLYAAPQIDLHQQVPCPLDSEALLDFSGRRVVSSDDVDNMHVISTLLCREYEISLTVSIIFSFHT